MEIKKDSKVSIRALRKTYGKVVALSETDLEVKEGEFLTLLGPSGSGKTTLLSMVAGLTIPDSGEIRIDGRDATHAKPEDRDIGMVFQNYALFPHMSVSDNIAFPLRMRKFPKAQVEIEVRRALEIVQLAHVAGRHPSQLSGGQQQRIALARCMVYRPSVILMDEPLGALDKKLREQMQLEIKRLHTELNITMIYVTHDQEEALLMSDRICLMNNAKIEQIDSPHKLYFAPKTLFAADFLGESNIFSAKVLGMSGPTIHLAGPAGISLYSDAVDRFAGSGKSVKAVVRPENIDVLPSGQTADNIVEGTLTDVLLAGQITRYYAQMADGQTIFASTLTRPEGVSLSKGDPIRFGWSRASTVIVPDVQGEQR